MPKPSDYLANLTQDHHTLLLAAKRLALRHQEQTEMETPAQLEEMLKHLEHESSNTKRMLEDLGQSPSIATEALVWLGERLGRLKLNEHIMTRSPLSDMTELEALSLCSRARSLFWESIKVSKEHDLGKYEVNQCIQNARADAEVAESALRRAAVRTLAG